MRITEYIREQDTLVGETPRFSRPFRAEPILRAIGRGKRVLDLGCGGGSLSRLIRDRNNEVFGVEKDPMAAAIAVGAGLSVAVGDLNEGIPHENSYFDVVNVGGLVGQVFDTRSLFEEMYRVLVPGGTLVLTAPNLNSLENRFRVLSGTYPASLGAFPEDRAGGQIRAFNLAKLRELCEMTGFDVEKIRGVASIETGLGARTLLRPLLRARPQWAELLVIKARRRARPH